MSNEKWYVQHKSGDPWPKYEVVGGNINNPCIIGEFNGVTFYLPNAEYCKCAPPEQWVDVTGECVVRPDGYIVHEKTIIGHRTFYRFRKVPVIFRMAGSTDELGYAFIVERKQ